MLTTGRIKKLYFDDFSTCGRLFFDLPNCNEQSINRSTYEDLRSFRGGGRVIVDLDRTSLRPNSRPISDVLDSSEE